MTVHFVVPEGIDDPSRPSGGNLFDRRVLAGLGSSGWAVRLHEVGGSWPDAGAASYRVLAETVGSIPDGSVVLLDGLVASTAPDVLVPESARLRLVVLVHLPLGHGTADEDTRQREGAVLSAARAVVTTSAWARRALLGLYRLAAGRIHVAEPGAAAAPLAPGTASAGALLAVAAVTPGKGHDLLVEALTTLPGRWRCECVGSLERAPAYAESLRRRAAEGRLAGRILFPGPQAGNALDRSYGAADVLVLPSRFETYGMVVTEALARALPVIATEVGGVPEALGHGADGTRPGLLVPPDDPRALGDALKAWLEDAELRRRLRRAARERRASLPRWPATTAAVGRVLAGAAQ